MKTETKQFLLIEKTQALIEEWQNLIAAIEEEINNTSKYGIQYGILSEYNWRLKLCKEQLIDISISKHFNLENLIDWWKKDISVLDKDIKDGKHGVAMQLESKKKCLESCIKDLQKLLK